jgi:hypothetical protein
MALASLPTRKSYIRSWRASLIMPVGAEIDAKDPGGGG